MNSNELGKAVFGIAYFLEGLDARIKNNEISKQCLPRIKKIRNLITKAGWITGEIDLFFSGHIEEARLISSLEIAHPEFDEWWEKNRSKVLAKYHKELDADMALMNVAEMAFTAGQK